MRGVGFVVSFHNQAVVLQYSIRRLVLQQSVTEKIIRSFHNHPF